jgi:plasmid stabilization system protein ParE
VSWRVRYAPAARDDIKRLYGFLLEHDIVAARRALTAIVKGVELLQQFPFTCRKIDSDNPLLRELLVSFGASGYALQYEIDDDQTVTILAVRHQREDDYH